MLNEKKVKEEDFLDDQISIFVFIQKMNREYFHKLQ
jgi:hypothetical protein